MVSLTGLQVESFHHPAEKAALDSINKAKWLKKLLDWTAEKETQFNLRVNALGKCFIVTPRDMPELYRVVEGVCETLDYSGEIRVFTYRSSSFEIGIFAGEPSMLLVPDFVLSEFDEAMLRFKLGRAVTALKADTVQLTLAVSALSSVAGSIPALGDVVVAGLADWARKSKLTQDRGGLLACQDRDVAFRALIRECGLPLKYIDAQIVPRYVKTYQMGEKLVNAAQYAMTVKRMSPWNNDRLMELLNWIQSGEYDDILEEYE